MMTFLFDKWWIAKTAASSIAFAFSIPSVAQTFTGAAQAIDGDSLHVGNREVRLFGIDAPEYHQSCKRGAQSWSCGANAAGLLARLVNGKTAKCEAVDTDEYGRTVARCSAGNLDLNRVMVAFGYAVAYRHYSLDYVSAEETARANKRGLWSGTFKMPSMFRHEDQPQVDRAVRQPGRSYSHHRSTPTASGACVIKGNRGPHGWIYHLPGMPYYQQTRAEQMFCSERDAQAAGYRRAKVR
jgi:endonuclease YncB( thermonuclease family)